MTGISATSIKDFARTLGFTRVGIAPVESNPESTFFNEWLSRGYAGEMHYLERGESARMDPSTLLPGIRSVIVCAINYNTDLPRTGVDRLRAWISRYAWGADYHDTVKPRLNELARWIQAQAPAQTRVYVDTGPVNERVFAKYAGIGWFGKNTCIIDEKAGSWLFLGCILTDLPVDPGAICTRQPEVYFLHDHRTARGDSGVGERRYRASPVWLRHLPGCLPLESKGAGEPQ
jgi:epoxyqueuosine reductase